MASHNELPGKMWAGLDSGTKRVLQYDVEMLFPGEDSGYSAGCLVLVSELGRRQLSHGKIRSRHSVAGQCSRQSRRCLRSGAARVGDAVIIPVPLTQELQQASAKER